jgi:hypothetical protein
MGTSPDEDLISYVHVAHGLEVSSQTNTNIISKRKLDKLPRYLRAENQLDDRDWDVLQNFESILTVFETVVRSLEQGSKSIG